MKEEQSRARDKRFAELRAAGQSIAEIATAAGITGSRVKQILDRQKRRSAIEGNAKPNEVTSVALGVRASNCLHCEGLKHLPCGEGTLGIV